MIGLPLARRLERAEAAAGAEFVEQRAVLFPDSGACRIEAAGALAMFDGPESPITQSFCLGLFGMPSPADMDRLEDFFHSRGASAVHEVSPLAAKPLLPMLSGRGYHPVELTDVMFLPLDQRPCPDSVLNPSVRVRLIESVDAELWAATCAQGWSEHGEVAGLIQGLALVMATRRGALPFLAEKDGHAIATGSLCLHRDIALLAGASTIAEFRRQGAQRALFEARLAHAAHLGCAMAMICAEPGSDSQRNAAHYGFRIAYTRIKWALDAPAVR